MKNRAFPVTVWVLLGILGIAAASLTLGRNDTKTFPSASSTSPSGTKAFADLLTSFGYSVAITQATKPQVGRDDILVGFAPNGEFKNSEVRKFIDDHVNPGGRAIVFSVPSEFPKALELSTPENATPEGNSAPVVNVTNVGSETRKVDSQYSGLAYTPVSKQSFTIAQEEGGAAVGSLEHVGRGEILSVSDGILATNRFIDRNENAAELMSLVQSVAPPHSSLVFYEASFGHSSERGILERIGTWALAAWWQLIFLFVVIVYTLGKPFGYPDEERPRQAGARELVDAVAQTYRRAHATHVALRSMLKEADSEIRKKLKLPLDSSRAERDALIPPSLAKTLANAEVASSDRIGYYDALAIARKLDEELASFIGQRAARYRRRRYQG